MIESSFIILERVGRLLEQKIWRSGVCSWNSFLNAEKVPGISAHRKAYYDRKLVAARSALNNLNSEHFLPLLPKSEAWRLFEFFKDETVYLDIETSGAYTDITVVGLFDGFRTMTMVKGINLDMRTLKRHLKRYKLIVSYNGLSFDAVVLERFYPGLLPRVPHFDLRFACGRLGLTGGLKTVEKELGIMRDPIVRDMHGEDAVFLWNAYKATGNIKHLKKLIAYNEEDIVNLQPIAEHCFRELKNQARSFMRSLQPAH